jgi:hypothetical protein
MVLRHAVLAPAPGRFPFYRFGGLILAFVRGFLLLRLWRSHLLPLQNFYLADYVLTSLPLPTLPENRTSDGRAGQKQFNVVMAGPAGGSIERDRRQTACDRYSSRSDARVSIHAARLSVRVFHEWLKKQITGNIPYQDSSSGHLALRSMPAPIRGRRCISRSRPQPRSP